MRFLPLLCLALMPTTSLARIGETQQECATRYGKGTPGKGGTFYHKGGMRIMAIFWNDKAGCLIFGKIERNALNKPKEMSAAEQEALLEANGGGSEWVKSKGIEISRKSWTTADGKAVAQYDEFEGTLIISSAEYLKHKNEERAKEEKKALDGF